MRLQQFYVYILTNKTNSVLYTGFSKNIIARVWQHKNSPSGFSKKYSLNKLVHFEIINNLYAALKREVQIKRWHKHWKIKLIENKNPKWKDLFFELIK